MSHVAPSIAPAPDLIQPVTVGVNAQVFQLVTAAPEVSRRVPTTVPFVVSLVLTSTVRGAEEAQALKSDGIGICTTMSYV
jgi:hypothetical protein